MADAPDSLPDLDLPEVPILTLPEADLPDLGREGVSEAPASGTAPAFPFTLDATGPGLGTPAPPPGGLTETQDSDSGASSYSQDHTNSPAPGLPQDALGSGGAPSPLPAMTDAAAGRPGAWQAAWERAFDAPEAARPAEDHGEKLDTIAGHLQTLLQHLTAPGRP